MDRFQNRLSSPTKHLAPRGTNQWPCSSLLQERHQDQDVSFEGRELSAVSLKSFGGTASGQRQPATGV